MTDLTEAELDELERQWKDSWGYQGRYDALPTYTLANTELAKLIAAAREGLAGQEHTKALISIALSSCCEGCQEAQRVAMKALDWHVVPTVPPECSACGGKGYVEGKAYGGARYYSPNPIATRIACPKGCTPTTDAAMQEREDDNGRDAVDSRSTQPSGDCPHYAGLIDALDALCNAYWIRMTDEDEPESSPGNHEAYMRAKSLLSSVVSEAPEIEWIDMTHDELDDYEAMPGSTEDEKHRLIQFARQTLNCGTVVPVAEPTVAGRKCEPSGLKHKNGLQPQPSVGELVDKLLEAQKPHTSWNMAVLEQAATAIKQQVGEIERLKSEIDSLGGDHDYCERQILEAEAEIERLKKAYPLHEWAKQKEEAQAEIDGLKAAQELLSNRAHAQLSEALAKVKRYREALQEAVANIENLSALAHNESSVQKNDDWLITLQHSEWALSTARQALTDGEKE